MFKINLTLVCCVLFIGLTEASTCSGINYYLTEVLANESSGKHIFTCEIVFSRNQYTRALVRDVYRGEVSDTVKIHTGNGSMGSTLMPVEGEFWLIISNKRKDDYYTTNGCYNLSRRFKNSTRTCSSKDTIKGRRSLRIVDQYFNLKSERFTGRKDLVIDRDTFAEAYFVEGKANHTWKHYRYNDRHEKRPTVAEIDYQEGNIEGFVYRFIEEVKPRFLEYESFTENGVLQYENYGGSGFRYYSYPNATTKEERYVSLNKEGDTVMDVTHKYIDYKNELSQGINFKDGYYLNMRDSLSFKPLAEGEYSNGKKVGEWKYYNKAGVVIDHAVYEYPNDTLGRTVVYGNRTEYGYEGELKNGRRIGLWKQYWNNELVNMFYYNTNSELQITIRYYNNGTRLSTPYLDDRIHGVQTKIDSNDILLEICEYKNGYKNGRYIKYDEEGKIVQESTFEMNRETTIYSTSTNAPMLDGFRHGYNVQLAGYTGWKMYEGEIHMGQNVGKHIEYRKDGSISTIKNYPTLKMMEERRKKKNPCDHPLLIKTEYYDKDGKLLILD